MSRLLARRLCCLVALALGVAGAGAAAGCAHKEVRRLNKASKAVSKGVAKGDPAQVREHLVPGTVAATDVEAMLQGTAAKSWAVALSKPDQARPTATVFVGPGHPVEVVWTDDGWRFAEDPTDVYSQHTPRDALRALVRASRQQRWDVLLRLAPKRYRTGLSVDDLEAAWTQGEHAAALGEARDRLAKHLAGAIVADAHEAALDVGEGHVARLEREGNRWVVVDF